MYHFTEEKCFVSFIWLRGIQYLEQNRTSRTRERYATQK